MEGGGGKGGDIRKGVWLWYDYIHGTYIDRDYILYYYRLGRYIVRSPYHILTYYMYYKSHPTVLLPSYMLHCSTVWHSKK